MATTRSAAPAKGGHAGTSRSASILTTLVLVITSIYFLAPLWWLLTSATKPMGMQFDGPNFWFNGFHLFENFALLVQQGDGIFFRWLLNSVLYSGIAAAIGTLIAGMAGYFLAKYRFKGRNFWFGLVLAAVLVPKILFTLPLFLMFSQVGLINNPLAFILPSLVTPFGVYLSRIFAAQSVPDEVIEAARLDGVSEISIFFRISVRMMAPALVTIFLFTFVDTWNNYLLPTMVINDSALQPLTVGLVGWNASNGQVPISYVVFGAFISIVPLLIAFLGLQRFWRSGLTTGAIK